MAASIETQRLISVSLGKIAQSRGQRGGINLHKNLLVATVLHKARTAYMMENFSYQQQQHHHQLSLQRQKIEQEQQLYQQQQQQQSVQQDTAETARGNEFPVARDEQVCQPSCDSEVGHSAGPSPAGSEDKSSHAFVPPTASFPEDAQEEMVTQECETSAVDKENNPPPAPEHTARVPDVTNASPSDDVTESEHIIAANKLSQEAQLGLVSSLHDNSNQQQKQNYSSGSPTCNGILKRRRDNVITPSDNDCSLSKKARVTPDLSLSRCSSFSLSPSSALVTSVPIDLSDYSSSDDSESDTDFSPMQTDNSQITNLVSIFNSGFSGLCAAPTNECSSVNDTCDQNDLDISSPPTYTTLTNMRPESPSPSRKMSEPSLMCSAEVGRLVSLPSALLLSA